LKQILINLTANALKFRSLGKIKITAAYDSECELLRVAVTDSGKGINSAD